MAECDPARMFDEFNRRYFGGRLPAYQVLFRSRLPDGGMLSLLGTCDRTRGIIVLHDSLRADPVQLAATLIHEMAHAASTGGHGATFVYVLRQAQRLGAPVDPADLKIHEAAADPTCGGTGRVGGRGRY